MSMSYRPTIDHHRNLADAHAQHAAAAEAVGDSAGVEHHSRQAAYHEGEFRKFSDFEEDNEMFDAAAEQHEMGLYNYYYHLNKARSPENMG